MIKKPKLLWVGDAVCHTGFARVTHNVIPYLQEHWDVAVLGINYHGDPHSYPYPIYPASTNSREDMWGLARLPSVVKKFNPDIILVNNDPWNVIRYIEDMEVPVVTYMPVDAPNMRPLVTKKLQKAALNICYTQFGCDELAKAGLSTISMAIVPHGVDGELYRPMDKMKARAALGFTGKIPDDSYIVGNVNRNQPRKRLDLTIMSFAKWVQKNNIPENVYLHFHCGLRDVGYDIFQLVDYFGLAGRVLISDAQLKDSIGVDEKIMPYVYNCFDVQISTTLGEGWGLTTHEGMACGIPQIVPEWSALGEWPHGAVRYVPISGMQALAGGINTIGGVVSEDAMAKALDQMYRNSDVRAEYSKLAYERATETRFTWASVSAEMLALLGKVIGKPTFDSKNTATGLLDALESIPASELEGRNGIHG